jgi:hypothetical protein
MTASVLAFSEGYLDSDPFLGSSAYVLLDGSGF